MSTCQRFRALLEPAGPGHKLVMARLPFTPEKVWKTRQGKRVKGTINGVAFRAYFFGSTEEGYGIVVNKQLQKRAHAYPGDQAKFAIEPDLEKPAEIMPPELARLLKQDRPLARWFQALSPALRRYYCDTVRQPKHAETRQRRAERTAESLMLAMEGEEALPPILQLAFRRAPRAQAGWQAVTKIQRRNHLLAIFHDQSPESRERRTQELVEEAISIAGKST
jgi:uncharacterized protein YdeI (YjbR/CyaY-like superfamily)